MKTFKRIYKVVDIDSYEGIVGKYPKKSRTFDDSDIIIVTPKNENNKSIKEILNLKEGDIIIVTITKND